jgi:hypothetical protein
MSDKNNNEQIDPMDGTEVGVAQRLSAGNDELTYVDYDNNEIQGLPKVTILATNRKMT